MRSCSSDEDSLFSFVDSVDDSISVGQANREVASEVAHQVLSSVWFGYQTIAYDVFQLVSELRGEFFDVFERSFREEDPINGAVSHP